jgi:hypothetical protein
MQTTSVSPLRPFTVPQLLDRTFRIYRDNFLPFFLLVAVVTVPLTIFELLGTNWITDQVARSTYGTSSSIRSDPRLASSIFGNATNIILLTVGISAIVGLIQGILINGVLTYVTSERHLGRRATLGEAFRAVRGRLVQLGIGLIVFDILIGLVIAALTVVFFACGLGIGAVVYLGIALYAFLTPVLILERTSLGLGLKRAWVLGKARIWPVTGLIVAVSVITFIISFGLTLSQQLVANPTLGSTATYSTTSTLQLVVQTIIGIFVAPVLPIGLTLMYYDTRVRLEGLDIALSSVGTPEPRPSDVASPEPMQGWFMSGRDLTNLGIFAVGTLVVAAVLVGIFVALVGGLSRLY